MNGAPTTAAAADPASLPPAVPHPLTVRHFRNLWIGSTVSLLGDQFYLVALPWLVLELKTSSVALATILMTATIPRALFMLVGGAVIDRFSARRVLLLTASIRTVLVGFVAALIWLQWIELWHLYLLTFTFGVADAFSFPAGPTLMPSLVKPEQLRPANALFQTSTVMAQMAGPAPAGLLIKSFGIASALFFDALSFLVVIAALFRIPEPPKAPLPAAPAGAAGAARPSMLHSIAEGLRTVRNDPALLSLMVIFASINFCISGPIAIGLAKMAKTRFDSAAAFGTLLSSFSAGMLVGLLLGGFVKRPRKRGLQFILMSGLCGLELIGIGFATKLVTDAALLAVMGLGVGFVNVQFSSWVQLRVERAVLGRVMSVLMFAAIGLVPFSYAIAGFLGDWSIPSIFFLFGGLLAATSALTVTGRAAREID